MKVNVSFLGLLTLLFIGLKLGGVIAWSWWWVLAPTWIPVAIGLAVALVAVLFAGIVFLMDEAESARRKRYTARR